MAYRISTSHTPTPKETFKLELPTPKRLLNWSYQSQELLARVKGTVGTGFPENGGM
jgi:hypothetical protein